MTKFFVSMISLVFASQALAGADYVGSWCDRYDDFTEVLIIDAKDQVIAYTIGNTAGEKSPNRKGFISLGASGFQMRIDNYDMGFIDYKVRQNPFSKRRQLILKGADGENEKFTECSRR